MRTLENYNFGYIQAYSFLGGRMWYIVYIWYAYIILEKFYKNEPRQNFITFGKFMNLFTIYLFTSYHFMNKIAMPQYVASLDKSSLYYFSNKLNFYVINNLNYFCYRVKWSKIQV